MLDELGWEDAEFATARLAGGVSLAFTAPLDALYAASAINEWAWAACDHDLNGADAPDFDTAVTEIREAIADEANPALVDLETRAAANGVTMLWDDDEVLAGARQVFGDLAGARTPRAADRWTGRAFATCRRRSSRARTARRPRSGWLRISCARRAAPWV